MYNKSLIKKFIELKAKNIPHDKISAELKVSGRTLTNWSKKYLNEILYQKQIELDELKTSLNISDVQNLEFYSKIIEKCKQQFLNANFEKTDCSELFKIFNFAVNQVQKCKYINMEDVTFDSDSKKEDESKSIFYSRLFNNRK